MSTKQVLIRLNVEEYEALESEAKKLSMTPQALAKYKVINVSQDEVKKEDHIATILEVTLDISNDSNEQLKITNMLLRLMLEQTWTILQTINASSDEEGRKIIQRLIDISKDHTEKLILKSGGKIS